MHSRYIDLISHAVFFTDTQTCDENDECGFFEPLYDVDDSKSSEDVNEKILDDDDDPTWTPKQSDNVYTNLGEDDYESLGSGKARYNLTLLFLLRGT